LNFTFSTDNGKQTPTTKANSNAKINGRRRIVIGGTKSNATIKTARIPTSIDNIIAAVIAELIPGIDLGK
jgi:hypothetical protein